MTHQNRVCHVKMNCMCVCACRYLNSESIWLHITWVITHRPIKQGLGCFLFVTVYTVIKFTHGGVSMHLHTRCKEVWGVSAHSRHVIMPLGSWMG